MALHNGLIFKSRYGFVVSCLISDTFCWDCIILYKYYMCFEQHVCQQVHGKKQSKLHHLYNDCPPGCVQWTICADDHTDWCGSFILSLFSRRKKDACSFKKGRKTKLSPTLPIPHYFSIAYQKHS